MTNNIIYISLDVDDTNFNASAILYSLIETAKANGLTHFNYLMFLLRVA